MNGKIIVSKGPEYTTDNFNTHWFGFSFMMNELIIIEVRATGNEYLVQIINQNGTYSGSSKIVNPPKELLDNVNLLNGSRYDFGDTAAMDYRSSAIETTPTGSTLELQGLYRAKWQADTVFRHFRFFKVAQTIEYEQIEITQPTKERAVKV